MGKNRFACDSLLYLWINLAPLAFACPHTIPHMRTVLIRAILFF